MNGQTTNVPDAGKIIMFVQLAAIIIVIVIIYKILGAVGLVKTAASKAKTAAVKELRTEDYFNPDYWKDKKFKSLGANTATLYAQYMRQATRGFGTNEERIFTTFGKLYNKVNISEVADSYKKQYSRDLQTDLLNELTKSEAAQLIEIINGLPNF